MNNQTPPFKQAKGPLCRPCKCYILTILNWMLTEIYQAEMAASIAPKLMGLIKRKFKFYNVHMFTCSKTLFMIMRSLLSCLSLPVHCLKRILLMFRITESRISLL